MFAPNAHARRRLEHSARHDHVRQICFAAVLMRHSPGIPGDSGSAFFDGKGLASGVLSTLQFAPVVGANGVGFLANELAYARTFSDFASLELALGTEPFAVRVRRPAVVDRLTFIAALDRPCCLRGCNWCIRSCLRDPLTFSAALDRPHCLMRCTGNYEAVCASLRKSPQGQCRV